MSRAALVLVGAFGLGTLAYGALGGGRTTPPSALPYYESADLSPQWAPVAHTVQPFRLVTQTGTALSERELEGRIHVASFIFTKCPNLCPMLVERLQRVQTAARAWPDVRLVSYSVTPELDTPEVLSAFGRAHGIDPDRWWLATGDPAVIRELARTSYFAADARTSEDPATKDALLHSESVVLVDRERHLRGVYNGTQPFEVERLIEDIRTLRKEGRS
jgi:protein SCO1/2